MSEAKAFEALSAVILQFWKPEKAHGLLKPATRGAALLGAALAVTAVSFLPLIISGGEFHSQDLEIPFWILFERIIMSLAGGLSVYALSFALGERKPLLPAASACFLAMGAFMLCIAFLSGIAQLFSFPAGFTWSPAELMLDLPVSRLSVFTLLFASRLDAASLFTVYLWGRGLTAVWGLSRAQGQRMAWTIFLFGILLLTLPVFIAAPGGEGAP